MGELVDQRQLWRAGEQGVEVHLVQDAAASRLVHDPEYRDGVVDVIGYAALLPEVTG